MCYTIEINLTREQLEKRFQANLNKDLPYRKQYRLSAFSFPDCPVICSDSPNIIKLLNWGLIPSWSRDAEYAREIRTKTINAKSETLLEKPSFRHLVKSNKCLVAVSGFYEWQLRGKEKQPFFIRAKNKEITSLAGLHDQWTDKVTGEVLDTFTVITTRANPLMEKIHNTKKRMPVILNEQDENAWLDPQLSQERSMDYLKPFDEKDMFAEEVDKLLFRRKKQNEDPTLF